MSEKELEYQVKDLNNVLLECVEHSPKLVESIIKLSKMHGFIKHKLDSRACLREIKKRKLTNEYIKQFNSFDIKEALKIETKDAKRKCKDFDFTTKEKNIILNKYMGDSKSFILNRCGEVSN